MATTRKDARLPPELIGAILDYMNISQLVRYSHVCSTWRAIARAHPVFWRYIELRSLKPGSLEIFLARLCANTSGGGIDLCIRLSDTCRCDECQVLFRYIVLPAVQDNLFRIADLWLHYSANFFPVTLDALTRPAPLLKRLTIYCEARNASDLDLHAHRLGTSFLGGGAPNLRFLSLWNIALPGQPHRISALQRVEGLCIRCDTIVDFADVLWHFPALQQLTIVAQRWLAGEMGDYVISQSLTALEIYLKDASYGPFFSAFRTADLSIITHLTCPAHVALEWMTVFLRVFEGPLTLTLLDRLPALKRDRELTAVFSSEYMSQYPTRSLYFPQDTVYWPSVHDALFAPEIRARVTIVRLLALRALIVPDIGEFPACDVLELRFDDRRLRIDPLLRQLDDPWLPYLGSDTSITQFPALRTIVCFCDSQATITVETLSFFLVGILGPQSSLELLRMANIEITGDVDALKQELGCNIEQ